MRAYLITILLSGAALLASCSRAHEPNGETESGTSSDTSPPIGRCSQSECQPRSCVDMDPEDVPCLWAGREDVRCAGCVVHCPTAVEAPECQFGGVACYSIRPGGGLERPICVLNTAPDQVPGECRPRCSERDGILDCFNTRTRVPCDGYVVQCPSAGHEPECIDYSTTCRLPDGTLERPICVRE